MGDIIGGIVGAVGSYAGAKATAKAQKYAADRAAETARLGFDWLKGDPRFTGYLDQGSKANNAIGGLLLGGDNGKAFDAYRNSTGYNFRLGQGREAITGSNASKGLLNSGATAKALTQYGQNIGSAEFSNYLGQLGGLANAGLAAGQTIGSAGSSAGAAGAGAIGQGYGQAAATTGAGFQNALGNLGFAANAAWDRWGGGGGATSGFGGRGS